MGQPWPLFHFIFDPSYKDSSSDRHCGRHRRWPLDNHHGPTFQSFLCKELTLNKKDVPSFKKRGIEPRPLSLKASWLTFEPSRNHLTWLRLKERTSWQDTWLFWSPGNSRNPDREGVALKSKLEPSTQTWRPQIRIFFNNESEKRQPESQFDVSDRVIFRSDNGKTNSAKKIELHRFFWIDFLLQTWR